MNQSAARSCKSWFKLAVFGRSPVFIEAETTGVFEGESLFEGFFGALVGKGKILSLVPLAELVLSKEYFEFGVVADFDLE